LSVCLLGALNWFQVLEEESFPQIVQWHGWLDGLLVSSKVACLLRYTKASSRMMHYST